MSYNSFEKKPHYIIYFLSGKENVVFNSAINKEDARQNFEKHFDEKYSVKEVLNQKEYFEKSSKNLVHKIMAKYFLRSN